MEFVFEGLVDAGLSATTDVFGALSSFSDSDQLRDRLFARAPTRRPKGAVYHQAENGFELAFALEGRNVSGGGSRNRHLEVERW